MRQFIQTDLYPTKKENILYSMFEWYVQQLTWNYQQNTEVKNRDNSKVDIEVIANTMTVIKGSQNTFLHFSLVVSKDSSFQLVT